MLHNTYSVPSRLIGVTLAVRVRAETLELYIGSTLTLTLPDVMKLTFATTDCRVCTHRAKCIESNPPRRTLTIRPRDQYEALQAARARADRGIQGGGHKTGRR